MSAYCSSPPVLRLNTCCICISRFDHFHMGAALMWKSCLGWVGTVSVYGFHEFNQLYFAFPSDSLLAIGCKGEHSLIYHFYSLPNFKTLVGPSNTFLDENKIVLVQKNMGFSTSLFHVLKNWFGREVFLSLSLDYFQ